MKSRRKEKKLKGIQWRIVNTHAHTKEYTKIKNEDKRKKVKLNERKLKSMEKMEEK